MERSCPRGAWIFFDPAASRYAADAKLGLAPSEYFLFRRREKSRRRGARLPRSEAYWDVRRSDKGESATLHPGFCRRPTSGIGAATLRRQGTPKNLQSTPAGRPFPAQLLQAQSLSISSRRGFFPLRGRLPLQCCADETTEEGMRVRRPRLELGVELAAQEPRLSLELHDLRQLPVR